MTGDTSALPNGDDESIEIPEDLEIDFWDPTEGYRTCPECGRDCEPVPFDVSGQGIRVSMICPLHGVHTVVDPFEGNR